MKRPKRVVRSDIEVGPARPEDGRENFTSQASRIGNARMQAVPAATVALTRRLWAREAVDRASPEQLAAAMIQVRNRLGDGLGRWIGAEGFNALLLRVSEEAGVTDGVRPGSGFLTVGESDLSAAIRTRGPAEAVRGFVTVVALLIHQLSQVIGEDMAARLVEQAWFSHRPARSDQNSNGVQHG